MEKAIEGGQCERERVVHPSEQSGRFVSNSPAARSRKSPAALQLQQLCASKFQPGSARRSRSRSRSGPFPRWTRGSSAHRRFCGEFGRGGGVACGGHWVGARGEGDAPGLKGNPPRLQTFRPALAKEHAQHRRPRAEGKGSVGLGEG